MKNIGTKIAAVAFVMLTATPALAGKGGSYERIKDAVNSGSVDAITAEIERAEGLMCRECVTLVTNLLEDNRYEVREVAAWWVAKRGALKDMLATQFIDELQSGGTIKVRNAADFLGRTMYFKSLPALKGAITRDVGAEAKTAMVRAVKYMGHIDGNAVLLSAMTDANATVRASAANAWRDIRKQANATPVVALLGDADATVRAEAATTVGGMKTALAVGALEALAVSDADPIVRRNAVWALGQIGASSSRDALTAATQDKSGLVRMGARVALTKLH